MEQFNRLKEVRQKLGLTQAQVAYILEVGQSNIAQIERGDYQLKSKHERLLEELWNLPPGALTNQHILPVPVIGVAACGIPKFNDGSIEGWVGLYGMNQFKFGDIVAVTVEGDSMEPEISSGDTAYVDIDQQLSCGDIGAFYYEGGNLIKRYKVDEVGQVRLISDNSEYKTIDVKSSDEFKIIGKVVSIQKYY